MKSRNCDIEHLSAVINDLKHRVLMLETTNNVYMQSQRYNRFETDVKQAVSFIASVVPDIENKLINAYIKAHKQSVTVPADPEHKDYANNIRSIYWLIYNRDINEAVFDRVEKGVV